MKLTDRQRFILPLYFFFSSFLTLVLFIADMSNAIAPAKLARLSIDLLMISNSCIGVMLYSDKEYLDSLKNDDDEIE